MEGAVIWKSENYGTAILFLAALVLSISILAPAESYTVKTSLDKFLGNCLVA